MTTAQWLLKTEIGNLYLVASERGLKGAYFHPQSASMAPSLSGEEPVVLILAQAVCELEEYFQGQRQTFTVPLDLEGTEFQKKVWAELLKIPYGVTRSYRDIAIGIANHKAVRAVGTANGRNPLCVIVPCHRVISADGSLGGYTGGLEIKSKLLELERKA